MVFKVLILGLLFGLLAACSSTRQPLSASEIAAQQVSAEGSALIELGGSAQARQDAIEAAVSIAAQQLRKNHPSSSPVISDIKVVDEWEDSGIYHVQILALLSNKSQCETSYRKKIVATAFPIMNNDQLSGSESQDLFGGIPREINNHLMETGSFIGRNQTNTVLFSRPDLAPEIIPDAGYIGSSILNIAREQNAQFVLAGVIRDFKTESAQYVRGSGIFAEIKSLVRDMVARRSIGIDVYVYDGFSGALLFQQRYTDSILGDVSLPAGYTVGSERFKDTSAGHAIDTIIQKASYDIQQLLQCTTFASRVTEINGNHIVIAAGSQDKVRPGDQFKLYPATTNASGSAAGISPRLGVLTITDVNATSAIGTLDGDAQIYSVHPGDWVKSSAFQ
jgi:hypothetical protein